MGNSIIDKKEETVKMTKDILDYICHRNICCKELRVGWKTKSVNLDQDSLTVDVLVPDIRIKF